MKLPCIKLTDHGSEIALLAAIAIGVVLLLWRAIERKLIGTGFDVAAFLLVLQRIIEAVQGRWTQRSVDRMGASLANSPPAEPAATEPKQ